MSREMDARLSEMEASISNVYEQAIEETTARLNSYMEQYEEENRVMRARLLEGEITKEEYEEWARRNLLRTQQYSNTIDSLTEMLVNADTAAIAFVNGELPYVVAESYNFTQFVGHIIADHEDIPNVSFQIYNAQSVQALVRDNPQVFPIIDTELDTEWNRTRLNREITQGIIQGSTIPQLATRLQRVGITDRNSAIRAARTSMTSAENMGRNESHRRITSQGINMVKRWSATYDARTRDTHKLLDNTTANEKGLFGEGILDKLDEPLMRYPADPKGAAAEIYNCFVGDTVISADSNIIRTYKHEYKGKLLTIKTSSGIEFTCTPNHPILTFNGWIAAERLNEGDDLIVTTRSNNVISGRNPNINHAFTRFDALHEFFNKIGSKRIRTLGVNFHGDIPTSDVEIVTQKRFLRNNRNTGRNKLIYEFLFIFSDKSFLSDSSFVKHLRCVRLATLSLICRRSKSFAFFISGLRHSKVHSLRPIALLDSGFIKSIDDSTSADVKILCETLNGFSGVVFSDKIISVDINEGSAHVYNLQSENGYYFVNSNINQINKNGNGIFAVAHNCRCRLNIVPPDYSREANAQAYERWMQENYPADYNKLKGDDKHPNYFNRLHKTDGWTAEAQQRFDRRVERRRKK
jgi:hypothetical protein